MTTSKTHLLSEKQLYDLEMLSIGAFSPLKGFLREKDYLSILNTTHLSTGELWSLPIVLPTNISNKYQNGEDIILINEQNIQIAYLRNIEIYKPNLPLEFQNVYGTLDDNHPHLAYLNSFGPNLHYLGGEIEIITPIMHYDFSELRLTPMETKAFFQKNGWKTIVGFQTRNPMHKSHYHLTLNALKKTGVANAKLLINPVVGPTQECDINYYRRVRCYQKILKYYPSSDMVKLVLLPLSMRMAGPREALHHALIRQNYGCTHFIIGRDHAGPSYKTKEGKSFYQPYQAHELLKFHQEELKIQIIMSEEICYLPDTDEYLPANQITPNTNILVLSGTEQRRLLQMGEKLPSWFTFPDIHQELSLEFRPLDKQGFCISFIGLSGAGKSTLAVLLENRLKSINPERKITILDGDIVRQNLCKELGFSRQDRSTNVQRIGFVASEIVKHHGICICANISPYEEDRLENRRKITNVGGNYIEIYLNTSLDICEERDHKGLYKLARQGIIKEMTGISDPFEIPTKSELIFSSNRSEDIKANIERIIDYLYEAKLLLEKN